MGIRQLSRVIADNAPRATTEHIIKEYFGRRIAIDASMSIYQFLIAVRSESGQSLTNELGEATSHLMGMFYRTIRMLENGIKPVYVFDGKPPQLKSRELARRGERRSDAERGHSEAHETGDAVAIEKFAKRTVKVTPKHNEECKRLLSLMGVPFIQVFLFPL
jgi:flap endonuclease-1